MVRIPFAAAASVLVLSCTPGVAEEPGRAADTHSLAEGTLIGARAEVPWSWSRRGSSALVTAIVTADVANEHHTVVVPAGSEVRLRLADWAPEPDQIEDPTVVVDAVFLTVRGRQYVVHGRGTLQALAAYPRRGGTVVVGGRPEVFWVLSEGFSPVR